MILFYLITWLGLALPFTLVSGIGLLWHRRREQASGNSLCIGLVFGPLTCVMSFGGWALGTVVMAPAGDPPIGAGVAVILGVPALLITTAFTVGIGYYEWSDFE